MPLISKKVYIAPSAFYALIDRAHPKNEQAAAFFRFFAERGYMLFTDTETLIETYKHIYKEISPSLSKDFLRTIFLGNINIIYPEESDIKAALKTLVNYQSTELTFSQSLRAVLANRRGITQVFTFDYLHPLFGISVFYLPI
jgi:predicted nucleic acid-binding protein